LLAKPFKGERTAKRWPFIEYADFPVVRFAGVFEHEHLPQIRDGLYQHRQGEVFHRDCHCPSTKEPCRTARAAHCASEQGKFWEMHDSLLGDTPL